MKEVERIKKICCQEMGLPYAHLTTSRKRPIPEVKQLITYFLTTKLKMSPKQIGVEINLDRSSVFHNLKIVFDPDILLSIEKKIDDPLYTPFVYRKGKNFKTAAIYVMPGKKKVKKIKEPNIKLYGRNLKEIDTEIDSLVKEMKTASYDKCIEASRRIDVLSIQKKNILNPLKKQTRVCRDVSNFY